MFWLNLVILLLLIAGHAELLVMLVNRAHALGLPCRVLRRIRKVHDAGMLLFPPVLVGFVGFHSPGVLAGGSWTDLPMVWAGYLAVCALGCLGLTLGALAWQLRPLPKALLSNHSETIDVERKLGRRPIGEGRYHFLAGLSFNEQFQVEVSDKNYRVPRCPSEWDGLSVLHLSDLHFQPIVGREYFEEVCRLGAEMQPDLVVFTGDLFDDMRCLEWLPETLGRLSAPLGCYFILGNHDWYLEEEPIKRTLCELGWVDVSGRTETIEHQGYPLAIGGLELPWMGDYPDFSAAPDEAFRLLLSHTPDHIRWAQGRGVDLMLSGHNHGGQVVLPVIGPVYSPSRFGCKYAAGAFWEDPTLLYVSRGVSGRQPFRYRCLPELTKLVLHPGRP